MYWCPRPESNRHAFRRGIFFPLRLSPPARMRCSWAGARLHHRLAALGARRLLSTPSPMDLAIGAWLGVGSGACAPRAFTEFDGVHLWSFLRRAQIVSSPLCLPVSPLGLIRPGCRRIRSHSTAPSAPCASGRNILTQRTDRRRRHRNGMHRWASASGRKPGATSIRGQRATRHDTDRFAWRSQVANGMGGARLPVVSRFRR